MFRPALHSVFLALCLPVFATPPVRTAPNPAAIPADQLVAAGNACGPTALLNALRFGNPQWQRASQAIGGRSDRDIIFTIIRERGMRPSRHLNGHPRWSPEGVNLLDLCDIGNELTRGHFLPPMKQEVFFLKPGESQHALLRRVHRRLDGSLAKGMPPVISLRRYVLRRQGGGRPNWVVLQAHFVTLTSLPLNLAPGARSFPVTYVDPWGGRISQGNISIPDMPVLADIPQKSPCLEAAFPRADVGMGSVRGGEVSTLTIAAILGSW